MKKIKTFAAVLAAVLGLSMIPAANAEAAEPVNYCVKYDTEKGDWLFQDNTSVYNDEINGREMYYMLNNLKDGDIVTVSNDAGDAPLLDLGGVRLGSLTITSGQFTMVKVGSADNFYANRGSSSSITGTITNAYVYYNALTNFNSNVKILNVYYERNNESDAPTVGCNQTVEQLNLRSLNEPNWIYDSFYNFAVNSLSIKNGVLLTEEGYYSRDPVALSTNATTANTKGTGSSSSSKSQYDDVPKTGQNNVYLWLLGTAAACFAGSGLLRKASH